MHDVASRIKGRVQLTTDGLKSYIEAVNAAFPTVQIPENEIKSISIIFRLCPDRYSVFPINDKRFNFFKFRFEPWIAEVFFDHLILHPERHSLRGQHPLLDGNHFN
ncbi:MAG: hypothetical protein C5B59_06875 [Bacteroidetes bacterium]|nr:MAG: hypothetical protein C5B59_06875 [Bacteroidota bacterium]